MPILNLFLCAIKISRGSKIKAQQSKRACCLRFADNKPFRMLGVTRYFIFAGRMQQIPELIGPFSTLLAAAVMFRPAIRMQKPS